MKKNRSIVIFVSFLLVVGAAEFHALKMNTQMDLSDQEAYLVYAKELKQTGFTDVGNRNQMPVYPFLMALLYREGMSDEDFYFLGKQAGIGLALLVLVSVFFIFKRYMGKDDALILLLVTAFTVFAFKAGYFQAELLYYGLSFLLFVLMADLVFRGRWLTAVLAGGVAGLAHLTKASALPGILICLLFLAVQSILAGYGYVFGPHQKDKDRWHFIRAVVAPVSRGIVMGIIFITVIFPYIRTSKEKFGQYFYNVNTTFYVWYDSIEEVAYGTRAHGDTRGWPDLPPEKIPGMGKYFRDHTAGQIIKRIVSGLLKTAWIAGKSYGYAAFAALYLLAAVLLFCQNRQFFSAQLSEPNVALTACFIVTYFTAYGILYAWYVPIAPYNRFVLALFLPAVFSLSRVVYFAKEQNLSLNIWERRIYASSIGPFILLMLFSYILAVFPVNVTLMWGGS